MDSIPWLLLSILFLVLLLALVFLMKRKGKKLEPDYYIFFIFGIIWLPMGIVTGNSMFTLLGIVFLSVGLANKDKWKKNRCCKGAGGKDPHISP